MKLLVTGPGRLGEPLLAELGRRGVTGAVLCRSGMTRLPAGWRSLRADVTRPESLVGVCADCETVLHLAAVTHTNAAARYDEVNALGTMHLVAEARGAGVQRFVLVSTRAISPQGGAYSRSKIRAEAIVRESGMSWSIVRPAEVYGTGGEGISALIDRCRRGCWIPVVGDGSARLAPIYLDDVVEGISRVVLAPGADAVETLAGPEEMTLLELIARLSAYFRTSPRVVRVPRGFLELAARGLALLPLRRPPLYVDQVARLLSSKTQNAMPAGERLGFEARALEAGLDALLRRPHGSPA